MSSSSLDILVPNLPESVMDATVAVWRKKEGDKIQQDEILVDIETDKIMLEVPSPETGILEIILEREGSIVLSGQILGRLKLISYDYPENCTDINKNVENQQKYVQSDIPAEPAITSNIDFEDNDTNILISPSIRKLITEHNINIKNIQGSGIKGRITRQDIETYIQKQSLKIYVDNQDYSEHTNKEISNKIFDINHHIKTEKNINYRKDTRIVMSRLRQKVSERLLSVTNSTAMLTTFNEVNMKSVINLRNKYKELFKNRYDIKLGFMSFYIKAVLEGLRRFPAINASIDGSQIIYHNYFDISIAVSTERGLVTPVLKNVDELNIAEIEKQIKYLADKGRNGKLTIEELTGGNFTITNGGIFGSLMSTPIINPPQSAILGMHVIKERPVALNGQVVISPMMYLALTYDHRLIDGKDSVSFLMVVKELIEDPVRLLLNI